MDVLSLTRQEAADRAELLTVERYDIAVDLSDLPTGPEVRCTSTVSFRCASPGAATFVDCAAEVVAARLNGVPLGPAVRGRIALGGMAASNTLVVETVQRHTTDGEGVHRAVDPADGEVYVWTSFEPDEARFVWACFDQPDLKAPHALTVTAPAAWTVLSNSGDAAVRDTGDLRVWTFPDTPPLSTYNPVVLAGPLYQLRRRAGGHDLGLFTRQSLARLLDRDAEELFGVTEQGLAFFGETFGMPFPQRRYDQAFMPEMGGAMENYGCVTWSDAFLVRAAPTPAERELLAKVLLHEMAHMWFGNLVTMRWWDDLWLNEAFAELASNWAAVRATVYTDAWAGQLATDKIDAYTADQGPTSHPIRQPVRDVDEAAAIFDAITYPKGAAVLAQLMTYVGQDAFAAGMKAYFAKHAWGNTTLDDLVDELAAASGRDLDAWRAGWLETAGTDRLTLERDDQGLVLVARGPDRSPPRPHVLAVGAYRRDGDHLARAALARVEVTGERTPVDLPAGADLYLVNDEDLTFATARPSADGRAALFSSPGALPTPLARGVAVATCWDMLVTGEARAAEVVGAVLSVLSRETSGSVVEPYLGLATAAVDLWAPDAERRGLAGEVAAACRHLAEDVTRRQTALRAFARVAAGEQDLAWLQEAARADVDLRWRALVRRAETAAVPATEVAALLAEDPDPDAWVRALAVTAAAPSPDAKESVWQRLVVERKVPISQVRTVTDAFWRPGQDRLLAPYAARFLDLLPGLHQGGMMPAMVYTSRAFPVFGVDASFLDSVRDAARAAAPVVRKTAAERADRLRRMLRSRAG